MLQILDSNELVNIIQVCLDPKLVVIGQTEKLIQRQYLFCCPSYEKKYILKAWGSCSLFLLIGVGRALMLKTYLLLTLLVWTL